MLEVNLEKRQIELSGARTKNGEAHIIPLTDLAIAQLPPRRKLTTDPEVSSAWSACSGSR